jgi:hypothetical protein
MLVDPELAALARELLREPDEAGGKGGYMSALGTHEISSGVSLGLEPPLSPPVVRSPMASAMPTGDGLAGLPTPPPAIRPPESATPPAVHAEVPQQPEPAPAPVQPEPVLPAVAPAQEPESPVLDYFAAAETQAAPEPAAAPGPAPVEGPAQTVELNTIPLVTPAPAPADTTTLEPVVLPTMAPPAPAPEAQPEPEPAPAAAVAPVELPMMAPQPLETVAPAPAPEAEPEAAVAPEPAEPSLTELEPAAPLETAPAPMPAPELEELFAPVQHQRQQSGFSVVVRLRDGDGVEVGSFRDFGTAMECAQEVIEQFSTATEARWPFYAGRFIRPDLIISVDVVDANADAV